ncbi:MAG: GNAT family N-acetyltransferase [Anaerolineales bacterium]
MLVREFCYPEDYQQVEDLWSSIESGVRIGYSDSREEIQKKLNRDPDLFLVAEEDGHIIGTVIGGFDGRRGMIYHLAVAETFQRRGIGSQLLNEVEARLRARGCHRCYLMVTTDNQPAMQYYEKRGWERMDYIVTYAKNLD